MLTAFVYYCQAFTPSNNPQLDQAKPHKPIRKRRKQAGYNPGGYRPGQSGGYGGNRSSLKHIHKYKDFIQLDLKRKKKTKVLKKRTSCFDEISYSSLKLEDWKSTNTRTFYTTVYIHGNL